MGQKVIYATTLSIQTSSKENKIHMAGMPRTDKVTQTSPGLDQRAPENSTLRRRRGRPRPHPLSPTTEQLIILQHQLRNQQLPKNPTIPVFEIDRHELFLPISVPQNPEYSSRPVIRPLDDDSNKETVPHSEAPPPLIPPKIPLAGKSEGAEQQAKQLKDDGVEETEQQTSTTTTTLGSKNNNTTISEQVTRTNREQVPRNILPPAYHHPPPRIHQNWDRTRDRNGDWDRNSDLITPATAPGSITGPLPSAGRTTSQARGEEGWTGRAEMDGGFAPYITGERNENEREEIVTIPMPVYAPYHDCLLPGFRTGRFQQQQPQSRPQHTEFMGDVTLGVFELDGTPIEGPVNKNQ
ncbi:hypothetical protein B7463_g10500, partial [Scytalidium lignicola]